MIKKAIQDLQEVIINENISCLDEADIVAILNDTDDERIYLGFENKKFTKMNIRAIDYQIAPKQLRRYFDDEDLMRNVPVEKVIEFLGPMIKEAWVRCWAIGLNSRK